jgi:hypothetical protein
MILRFVSGSVTPASLVEEALLRLHVHERHVEVAAEGLDDLLGLALLAQQPVVDEDAGELVADRLVDEQRGDGGVDAARERADHRSEPTWARMRSTCSSITAAGVQCRRAPATS